MSTPSTKSSFRSRMGSLIRRSSLITSRPGSPSNTPSRKKSSASISGGSSVDGMSTHRKSESTPDDHAPKQANSEPHLERLKAPPLPPPGIPSPIAEVNSQSPLDAALGSAPDAAAVEVLPSSEPTKVAAEESQALDAEHKEPQSSTNAAEEKEAPSSAQATDSNPLPPRVLDSEEAGSSQVLHDEPESLDQVAHTVVPDVKAQDEPEEPPRAAEPPAEPTPSSDPTTWPDGTPVEGLAENTAPKFPVPHLDIPSGEDTSAGKQKETPGISLMAPPSADPFADPPSPISYRASVGGFSVNAPMPEPQPTPIEIKGGDVPKQVTVVQPSPKVPSIPEIVGQDRSANETQPLLVKTDSQANYSGISMPVPAPNVVTPPASSTITTIPSNKYLTLGWIPYLLPSGRYYYVQPVYRVTTDIELQHPEKLETVMNYLKNSTWGEQSKVEVNSEMYLWSSNKVGGDDMNVFKVDHHRRFVTFAEGYTSNEEDLDKEYLYWLFLESHPAHTIPSVSVHQDAMDLVCWSMSDSLLPTPLQGKFNYPSPFSKSEAGRLSSLLKSFEDSVRRSNTPSISHTRLLSRIFARVLEYRQSTQRPNKPLPTLPSAMLSKTVKSRSKLSTFFRGSFTFAVCFLSLGIPLAFSKRSRFDEEAFGFRDTSTPSLMLGASVCLIAAVVLTASVSFLSLPGLDSIPRMAILVASLFASFAMISTVFTIFRLKADLETAAIWLGGNEDLLMISNRTILLSLPIVFLAYAIIAFVVAIVLYTFFTAVNQGSNDKTHPSQPQPTLLDLTAVGGEHGGRWVTLGVFGAMAGVIFATVVVLRR